MAAPVKITVGSPVWIKNKVLAWVEGEVTLIEDDDVKFTIPKEKTVWTEAVVTSKMQVKRLGTTSETVVPDKSSVLSKDPKAPELSVLPRDTKAPPEGVADLIELSHLHEPLILQNLANRYKNDNIYTYAGNILIAINPCKKIFPDLYDDGMMQKYKYAKTKDPHVFAIADIAYRSMIKKKKSNSILVSGESGAGKTETTKRLMTYLAHMAGETSETEETTIEKKLLQATPILEAFGNAKTERNDNSSRFGKYVEIQFDDNRRISGADIKVYLLEKSRVCRISNPERNYHCFYHVFGAPREDITKYGLEGYHAKSFHYLNQSNCYELDGVKDVDKYVETRKAMETVGISNEEQEAIFRVVAAILHLGNIEFAGGMDTSTIKDEKSRSHLNMTAKLLMCDKGVLEKALINRATKAGKDDKILKNLELDAAALSRDGLARTIYARLFDWLVEKINNSIGKVPNSESKSIGILDIYGFENKEKNSFEQFCINYANEKLQKHFNEHVLESEKEVYKQEGIEWRGKEFVANDDVLQKAIEESERKIALLDEKSKLLKSTDKTTAHQQSCMILCEGKHIGGTFPITHYAQKVTYEAKEFLEKNKDYVVLEHKSLLIQSKCPFIARQLFPQPREKASERNSLFTKSIGTCFKEQLQDLIKTLEDTQPHYIRCVKPNDDLKPNNFQMSNVHKQLRWSGAFEAIRVFCAGYPTRHVFEEFLKRYDILPKVLEGINCEKKDACKMILDILGLGGYKIGETKVFLSNGVLAELDARMAPTKEAARGDLANKLYEYFRKREVADLEKANAEEIAVLEILVEEANGIAKIEREANEKLKTLLRSKIKTVGELRKKLKDAEDEVKESKNANIDCHAKNEEMKKKLKDAEDDVKETKKVNTNAQAKNEELRKKLKDANTDAEAKNEELRKKLKHGEDEIKETEKANTDAEAKIEELTKKLKDADGKVGQLLIKSLEEKLSNNGSPTNGSAQQGAANFQENQDLLTKCISQDLGYSGDRPVAAFIIYKCLLHWRSFDIERTRVFDRIIQTMSSAAIEDINDVQAYWLSNSSTLLLLLQCSLNASGAASLTPQLKRPSCLLGRIFKFAPRALRLLRQIVGLQFSNGQQRQVKAKCPALLFKQQLTSFLEKRYGTMRDNLKKDISQLLELCIQAPRTSTASLVNGHPQANAIAHWQSIVKILNSYLNIMKANFVSPFLVRKVFSQIFYSINVQLFNSLLSQRECCSFSNGEYANAGLDELKQWCFDATEEYAGSAWDKMKHIGQAVGFLVTHEKPEKTLEDITNDLCPKLSIQQLHRISTLYWDDKYGTQSVSSDVISSMRVISNNAVSSSFLLEDDSSIPFSVDDISKSMQQIDINLDPLCKPSICNGFVM